MYFTSGAIGLPYVAVAMMHPVCGGGVCVCVVCISFIVQFPLMLHVVVAEFVLVGVMEPETSHLVKVYPVAGFAVML